MGVQLLLRDRKQLAPVARRAGLCAPGAHGAGADRAGLSLKLRANPLGGTLNLAILPAFGVHWLAPRLARLCAQSTRR